MKREKERKRGRMGEHLFALTRKVKPADQQGRVLHLGEALGSLYFWGPKLAKIGKIKEIHVRIFLFYLNVGYVVG